MSSKIKTNIESRDDFRERMLGLMKTADQEISAANDYLIKQGTVIDLTEWITIKEYCRRFGIKNTETISNWIKRGIIPADDTMTIEEFNNIRMVRAKVYKATQPAV